MNFFKLLKRVGNLATFFFTAYIIYQLGLAPFFNFLNIDIPMQIKNISELFSTFAIWLTLFSIFLILIILGIGYLVFTGWKYRKGIPLLFKILISFILGIIVFSLAAPISMVIKIPLIPTISASIILWIGLRTLSKQMGSIPKNITLEEAIDKAKKAHSSYFGNNAIEVKEVFLEKDNWIIKLAYSKGIIEYKINVNSGDVKGWRKI